MDFSHDGFTNLLCPFLLSPDLLPILDWLLLLPLVFLRVSSWIHGLSRLMNSLEKKLCLLPQTPFLPLSLKIHNSHIYHGRPSSFFLVYLQIFSMSLQLFHFLRLDLWYPVSCYPLHRWRDGASSKLWIAVVHNIFEKWVSNILIWFLFAMVSLCFISFMIQIQHIC